MATKKTPKSKREEKGKPLKVRFVGRNETTLQSLIEANLGLYIPLNQLKPAELKLLEDFLAKISLEPIALAHSDATDDDDGA